MLTIADGRTDDRGRRLHRQAYLLTGDPSRAERLTRRTLATAELQRSDLDPALFDEFAHAELVRSFLDGAAPRDPRDTPATARHDGNGYAAVWEAVRGLPPRRRAVIVLRYDEGLSEEHIAERLGSTARSVTADAEAGLLTLRARLGHGDDPAELVPAALAAAAGEWTWGAVTTVPAVPPVPTVPPVPPVPTVPAAREVFRYTDAATVHVGRPEVSHRRHRGRVLVSIGAAAAAAALVLVAVPLLRQGSAADADAASAPAAATADSPIVPAARQLPAGLLDWPARGARSGDAGVLPDSVAAWKAQAARGEAPTGTATVLFAGPLDGRQVVLLQARDSTGRARVAQLTGTGTDGLRLVAAELLRPGTEVLSVVPPQGRSGRIRVLVSSGATGDGLLASDVSTMPLRPVAIGTDGVSGFLPSPPGAPTHSRVVVLGSSDGPAGRPVLESGIVRADMLTSMPGGVEVGSPSIVRTAAVTPQTRWFDDGALLASKIGGGNVVVAALGPAQSATAPGVGPITSRLYEVRKGSGRWLGSIVSRGSKIECAGAVPVAAAGIQGELTALVRRCPMAGGMMPGIVHVVAGAGVNSVRVDLSATRRPAMQKAFSGSAGRPAGVPTDFGFTALIVVPMDFPCGEGRLVASATGLTIGGHIPVYLP